MKDYDGNNELLIKYEILKRGTVIFAGKERLSSVV